MKHHNIITTSVVGIIILVSAVLLNSYAGEACDSYDPDWRATPLDQKYSNYFHRVAGVMTWTNGQVSAVSSRCPMGHMSLCKRPLVYGMSYLTNRMSALDTDPYFFGAFRYFPNWPTSTVVCSECSLGMDPDPLTSTRWRCRTLSLSHVSSVLPSRILDFPLPSGKQCAEPPLFCVTASQDGITSVAFDLVLEATATVHYRATVHQWVSNNAIQLHDRSTNRWETNDTTFEREVWRSAWDSVVFGAVVRSELTNSTVSVFLSSQEH